MAELILHHYLGNDFDQLVETPGAPPGMPLKAVLVASRDYGAPALEVDGASLPIAARGVVGEATRTRVRVSGALATRALFGLRMVFLVLSASDDRWRAAYRVRVHPAKVL